MATTHKLPSRLHHTAYVSRNLEATRQFYEDVIGLPLMAAWCESDELFGAERTYCHLFFGLGDGSGLDILPLLGRDGPRPQVILYSASEASRELASKVEAALVKSRDSVESLLSSVRSLVRRDATGASEERT